MTRAAPVLPKSKIVLILRALRARRGKLTHKKLSANWALTEVRLSANWMQADCSLARISLLAKRFLRQWKSFRSVCARFAHSWFALESRSVCAQFALILRYNFTLAQNAIMLFFVFFNFHYRFALICALSLNCLSFTLCSAHLHS